MAYGNPATYRRAAAVLAALLAACSHAPRAVEPASRKAIALPSPGNPQPGWKVPAEAYLSERNRCIDEALRQQGLNRFGDLDGTTYPEGRPLELAEGSDRYRYVMRRRPDIATACTGTPLEEER